MFLKEKLSWQSLNLNLFAKPVLLFVWIFFYALSNWHVSDCDRCLLKRKCFKVFLEAFWITFICYINKNFSVKLLSLVSITPLSTTICLLKIVQFRAIHQSRSVRIAKKRALCLECHKTSGTVFPNTDLSAG